jgi:cobalt-zinc-cadmium efflux system membrane fusion protein
MRRIVWCVALLAACGGKDDHDHAEREAHGEHEGEDGHEGEKANEVRIDPTMLRDLKITTASSEARSAAETVAVLGELTVNQNAYAEVAAPVAARVVKVTADVGQKIEANQPLVTLSSADLGRARADLQSARARAELAATSLARKRDLAAERLVAQRELQEAEAEATSASAELRAAQAAVKALTAGGGGGSQLVLRAPVPGVVIERDVVQGQLVDPSKTLFRVGDLSRLWLEAHVFERDAVAVRLGTVARVTLTALPGKSFDAQVAVVGREVDASSRTISVRLELDNPDDVLRPGMSATVHLPLGDASGTIVAVPLAAVQRVGDAWCVFLPKGAGVFEVRQIGRGRELGGEVEVVRGLAARETVVVDGSFLLKAEADKARGEGGEGHHH